MATCPCVDDAKYLLNLCGGKFADLLPKTYADKCECDSYSVAAALGRDGAMQLVQCYAAWGAGNMKRDNDFSWLISAIKATYCPQPVEEE